MALVKIEDVIDHLDSEIRKALDATLRQHFPGQSFDSRAVYRTFKRMVYRKCSVWEEVPDSIVEKIAFAHEQ
jgi:hypothetical protein